MTIRIWSKMYECPCHTTYIDHLIDRGWTERRVDDFVVERLADALGRCF